MKNLKILKNILVTLLVTLYFSGFSQTYRVNEKNEVVKVTQNEQVISTNQIDYEIKAKEQLIELLKKQLDELYIQRKEVESIEIKKIKNKKQ